MDIEISPTEVMRCASGIEGAVAKLGSDQAPACGGNAGFGFDAAISRFGSMMQQTSSTAADDISTTALASAYGPMLDALQAALETEIGPLRWIPRDDATDVTRHDGSHALRVAAINGIGVRTAELDPPKLSRVVNQVLARHGFPEQPIMTGSPSGHLVCESVDPSGAEFTLLVRTAVDAWVDQPR